MSKAHRERFDLLAHCYDGRHIPVALIFFATKEIVVDFRHFSEEKRWIVASRLSEHMPIYKGLSTKQIWVAGIENKLRVKLEGLTLITLKPIPDDYLQQAIA